MRQSRGIPAVTLKLIAVAAMTADHIAWLFVYTYSPLGMAMHAFGRMTAPLMAFFIAEGYYHTRSLPRYAARLGIFALLSHLPYTFYATGALSLNHDTGVIYTLFLGLLALAAVKAEKLHIILKTLIVAAVFFVCQVGDWSHFAVLWVLIFGLLRSKPLARDLCFAAVVVSVFFTNVHGLPVLLWGYQCFSLGGLLILPLIHFYNGYPGRPRLKYFFYLYYPLHLVAIRLIWILVYR